MTESHVISGLVAKRGELAGEIDYHQKLIKGISDQLKALDAAIKVFDPEYKLRNIKAKKHHRKNHFFRHGEGNTLLMDLMREAGGECTNISAISTDYRDCGAHRITRVVCVSRIG